MDSIIEVTNLSKRYTIGARQPYITIRDKIMEVFKPKTVEKKNEFWALKNINFSVNRGEVVGLIGRNGVGKSTLLKIMSRITYPTSGEIKIQGSVSSLLEVGTGFSPELTGRENIFLNGSILGMTQKEIKSRFDTIVDFAEIEKFIDTPVKYYSSGMYTRLAFSVAAHLEPDILLVDEVLAVGDTAFQKKCLGKMNEVTKKDGRTIIFVSHNMDVIEQLCTRCILLKNGELEMDGPTSKVIDHYIGSSSKENATTTFPKKANQPGQIRSVTILDSSLSPSPKVAINHKFYIDIEYEIRGSVPRCLLGVYFYSQGDLLLFASEGKLQQYRPGKYKARVTVPEFLFEFGHVYFDVYLQKPGVEDIDKVTNIGIEVVNTKNPRSQLLGTNPIGKIATILPFEVEKL